MIPKNVKCKHCMHYQHEWCSPKADSPDPDKERDCVYFRHATNADRIRAMTDEDLAEWIERIRVLCANDGCGRACSLYEICYSMAIEPVETLDWLKQEVDE